MPPQGRRRAGRRVTDRARVEAAGVDAFIDDILSGIGDAVMIVDAAGRVLRANATCRDGVLGWDGHAEAEGLKLRDLFNRASLADEGLRIQQHLGAIDPRQPVLSIETIGPAGECLQIRLSRLARAGGSTDIGLWMLCVRDVTDSAIARSQRDAALDFLTQEVRATQSSMLSVIELGRMRVEGFDKSLVERVELQAWQTIGMSDRFTKLIRIQSQAIDASLLLFVECVTEVIDASWVEADAHAVQLVFQPPSGEVTILGSRAILVDALGELLAHCVRRARADTRITLHIDDDATGPLLRIRFEAEQALSPAELDTLTLPRAKALLSSATNFRGAHLRLAYVREALARHRARIDVSDLGEGRCALALAFPRALLGASRFTPR